MADYEGLDKAELEAKVRVCSALYSYLVDAVVPTTWYGVITMNAVFLQQY